MNVYLLVWHDRHLNLDVQVFKTKNKAVRAAAAIAEEYDCDREDRYYCPSDWVFHAYLSYNEDDYVYVIETELK